MISVMCPDCGHRTHQPGGCAAFDVIKASFCRCRSAPKAPPNDTSPRAGDSETGIRIRYLKEWTLVQKWTLVQTERFPTVYADGMRRIRPMSGEEFAARTGRVPTDDDLDRVNCQWPGRIGHLSCGWCLACDAPAWECTHSFDVNRDPGDEDGQKAPPNEVRPRAGERLGATREAFNRMVASGEIFELAGRAYRAEQGR